MISRQHQVIFYHNPKTAGTSIECALADMGFWPQPDSLIASNDEKQKLFHGMGFVFRYHMYAQHVTPYESLSFRMISLENFNRFFKFTFVRNPWDRLVSVYRYRQENYRKRGVNSFADFIHSIDAHIDWFDPHLRSQYEFTKTPLGEDIDFIGRYESLEKDMAELLPRMQADITLPHKYKTQTTQHYSEYYDSKLKDIARRLYRKDIDHFGYTFETA
jgi:hypothetical protein